MYIILFAGILNIFLGIMTFKYGENKRSIYSFAVFCLITGVWVVCNFLEYFLGHGIFVKFAYALGSVMMSCLLAWAYFYDAQKKEKVIVPILVYLLGISIFLITAFTNLVVADVQGVSLSGISITTGPLFSFWCVSTLIAYVSSIIILVRAYFLKSIKLRKKDVKIIWGLLGFGIFSMFVSAILPMFGVMQFTNLDSVSSLVFVILTFVAIVKNQFFGAKVFLIEILSVIMITVSLVDVFYAKNAYELLLRFIFFSLVAVASLFLIKSIVVDILRREELEIANAKLLKLDKSKSEFISVASHQLRTPLTTMYGFISVLKNGAYGEIPENLKEPIRHIEVANEKLITLTEELLSVTRLETGKMEFNLKEFDVNSLIDGIADAFALQAQERKIKLIIKKAKKLPLVKIDQTKMFEAISNIVDNALKYTEIGHILISTINKKNAIQVVIEDTGIGLSKEDNAKLFEKFSRGKEARKMKKNGVGLGLFFSKKIINFHKGKIDVFSKGRGKGSKFVIEIPASK
jgi:signal transduction histidine kinase